MTQAPMKDIAMTDGDKGEKADDEKPKTKEPKRSLGRKILHAVGIFFGVLLVGIVGFVIYVNATCERDFSSTPVPALVASKDPEIIKRGAYVTHSVAHCSACHGNGEFTQQLKLPPNLDDVRGGYVLKAGPFGTYYPANLTPHDTGIGKLSDGELARILRHGVAPNGKLDPLMAFAVGPMADEDIVAIMSYLRSIPAIANPVPKDEWGFVAKMLASKFNPRMMTAPPFVKEGEVSVERGQYLAKGPALCVGCHSPYDLMNNMALSGPEFSGAHSAEPDHVDPSFEVMAPNLTTDPKTGVLASYTEEAFLDRFKKAGRAVQGSVMPWENFARMTDDDLRSIYRFLTTKVPPANRATGPTRRPRGSWKG
jgi:mono/diheme cytochrome c family protein